MYFSVDLIWINQIKKVIMILTIEKAFL